MSHSGEPACHKNVSTEFIINANKVLMFKYSSELAFAVSEVEFINNFTTSKSALQFAESTID